MAAGLQLDSLYCQEDTLWVSAEYDAHQPPLPPPPGAAAVDDEEEWSALLSSLAAKERETRPHIPDGWRPDNTTAAGDSYLRHARRGAVEWVCRACARLGFSALTALLAVSYLDRCFLPAAGGLTLQGDRPWMERLSAVACLSLAAKVEETYVPLLLDLQAVGEDEEVVAAAAGGGGYVFEPKTVRRMELLVLSALKWRMNPVTPLSFIHHLLPKLATATTTAGGGGQLLWSCHTILLSLIADWRWVRYPPSVWAAAALLHATTGQPGDHDESTLALLSLTKASVEGCYQLISETMAGACISISSNKRNYYQFSYPPSPNGVIDTSCFSYDSASSTIGGECWITTTATITTTTMWPLSLEQRPFKRSNYTLG